jgi:effector-binding domain-containing protein
MITEPVLEYRPAQPFVAVRTRVDIPFGELLPGLWGETIALLTNKGLGPSGPPFIRYLTTDMEKQLDIEVGFPVAAAVTGGGRVSAGVFPAGRYAVSSYFGPYDNLVAATSELLAWAEKNAIRWDTAISNGEETWASRIEWYPTDPAQEPDPQKWQTELAFKVK